MTSSAIRPSSGLSGQGCGSIVSWWSRAQTHRTPTKTLKPLKSNLKNLALSAQKSNLKAALDDQSPSTTTPTTKGHLAATTTTTLTPSTDLTSFSFISEIIGSKTCTSENSISSTTNIPRSKSPSPEPIPPKSPIGNKYKLSAQPNLPSDIQSLEKSSLTESKKFMSSQKVRRETKCYMCRMHVREKFFKQHLFFGPVQCEKCKLRCEDCLRFAHHSYVVNTRCRHTFCYLKKDPFDYIKSRFLDDPLDFENYLESLSPLAHKQPWQKALTIKKVDSPRSEYTEQISPIDVDSPRSEYTEQISPIDEDDYGVDEAPTEQTLDFDKERSCSPEPHNTSIEDIDASEHILSNTYDINSLEQSIEYVQVASQTVIDLNTHTKPSKEQHSTGKSKSPSNSDPSFNLTSDDHYIVLEKATEECPECYTTICPSRFRVNVKTFLVTYVCTECNLTIYFAVSPKISIKSDSTSVKIVNKKKKDRMKKYHMRRHGYAKASDFFAK